MMPKSTAPMDSRLADLPRAKSTPKANSRASGMLIATITAVRTLPRNMSRMAVTRAMPTTRFSWTVSVVRSISVGAVVVRHDLDARRAGGPAVFSSSILAMHVAQGRQRFLALAEQHDALHHVVVVVPDAGAVGVGQALAVRPQPRPADADAALPRLVADHHAAGRQRAVVHPRAAVGVEHRAAVHQVVHPDGHVVDALHHDLADLPAAPRLLGPQERRGLHRVGHRRAPAAGGPGPGRTGRASGRRRTSAPGGCCRRCRWRCSLRGPPGAGGG